MVKEKKNVLEGIWILVVMFFGSAAALFFTGLQMFSTYDDVKVRGPMVVAGTVFEGVPLATFIGIGVFLLFAAALMYYTARGLLRARTWSRYITAIVSVVGIVYSIIMLTGFYYLTGIVGILMNGLIVWYLFFKKSVCKYFK